MQFAYTIHLLGKLYCQHTHGKLLMGMAWMEPAKVHELGPGDPQPFRVMGHIGAQEILFKGIMACRNRCMCGEQAGGTYHFHRFREGHVLFLNVFPQPFQTDKGCMPLIAMKKVGIKANTSKGPDSTNSQQDLLF